MKKIMPFMIVLIIPLIFAVFTCVSIKKTEKDRKDVLRTGLFILDEERNTYFTEVAFSKINKIELKENKVSKPVKILGEKEWSYNKEKNEFKIHEKYLSDIKNEKYFVVIEGIPENPARFILKDCDFESIIVFIDNNIALEEKDYSINKEKEELKLNKAFFPFDDKTKVYIIAKRKNAPLPFSYSNYNPPYEIFKLAFKKDYLVNYCTRIDENGIPQIYNNSGIKEDESDMSSFEETKKSFKELSKELGFKIYFPERIWKYSIFSKYIFNDIKDNNKTKGLDLTYSYKDNVMLISIHQDNSTGKSNFEESLKKDNYKIWKMSYKGTEVYFSKSNLIQFSRNYYIPKMKISGSFLYLCEFEKDNVTYSIQIQDYEGIESEDTLKNMAIWIVRML